MQKKAQRCILGRQLSAPTRRRDDSGDASSPTWGIILKKAAIVEVPALTADEHQHPSVLCHTTKSLLTTNIFQAAAAAAA